MIVQRYGITMQCGGKVIERVEIAESPLDAVQFSIYNTQIELGPPAGSIHVLHVGPPQEDIDRFTASPQESIQKRVASLLATQSPSPDIQ
jgi:hypothetical protein